MILAALVAASLSATSPGMIEPGIPYAVPVAIERNAPLTIEPGTALPPDQTDAVVQPLVSSATECIARTVSADPRFPARPRGQEFNTLIVDSVPLCLDALRSMIDTYDRLYGDGAGQTFFMGPYLDGLPDAVTRRVKTAP